MKCSFCGAHIDKDEELCPECGKYIFETASAVSVRETESNVAPITKAYKSEEHGENSVRFNYIEYIRTIVVEYFLIALLFLVGAVVAILVDFDSAPIYVIACVAVAILYILDALSKYKREKDCFIEINETTVRGIVPSGKTGKETESFEVKLSDIMAVQRLNGSKNTSPTVVIYMEDDSVVLYCVSRKLLKKVAEELKKRI